MRSIYKVILFYIFLSANIYADTIIFHKINKDGTRYFDIQFTFLSKHDVRTNFNILTDYIKIHRFKPSVFETEIISSDHKFFTSGKTSFTDHKEFLFITKVS